MKKLSLLLGRLLLVPVSWIPLSRLWGRLMKVRRPRWLALWMIRRFQTSYRITMDEFQGKPEDYSSLADFFLRPLDPATRPLPADERLLLSPVDGRLSEIELIHQERATQVKGWTYPLGRFLAAAVDFSKGWYLATIYLAPSNYHRYHFPVSGRIRGCFHGGTRLFPVNAFSCARVRQLYVKNERLVTRIEFPHGPLYAVAVGATFVGGIAMTFLPAGLPARNEWRELDIPVSQMAEIGHFAMGSTMVLLLPAAGVEGVLVEKGEAVRVGQPLFKLRG